MTLKRYSVGPLGERESDTGPYVKIDDVIEQFSLLAKQAVEKWLIAAQSDIKRSITATINVQTASLRNDLMRDLSGRLGRQIPKLAKKEFISVMREVQQSTRTQS